MNNPATQEHISYRLVVGNNTQTVHPVLGTFPAKGCIPLPVLPTGTLDSDNAGTTSGLVVKGTSTTFLSGTATNRPEKGDFLADANYVLRRIKSVDSDTQITLDAAFPSSLSSAVFRLVKKNKYRFILASSTGTAAASLDEQGFAVNDKFFNDGTPLSYDVTTASSQISFTLSE
jgi:hypothetical protein